MSKQGREQRSYVDMLQCVVPENIHTPPTEGIGNSGEEGRSQRPKNLKQCMKLNWNFRRGGGVIGQIPSMGGGGGGGGMDIFWNHTIKIV